MIVGILAAIAIPAYQDYTISAQVSEGLNLAAAPKPQSRKLTPRHERALDRIAAGMRPLDRYGR